MNISICRNGVEIGEWPEEQVRSLYQAGELRPTDHYWKAGMPEWIELYKMMQPAPAGVSKPVLRTQVITVTDHKFVQRTMPVSHASVQQQQSTIPDVQVKVDKEPSGLAKLFGKLFQTRD
jgi:NOL1/NOP2/fmu family ribosome biogenesis protein